MLLKYSRAAYIEKEMFRNHGGKSEELSSHLPFVEPTPLHRCVGFIFRDIHALGWQLPR